MTRIVIQNVSFWVALWLILLTLPIQISAQQADSSILTSLRIKIDRFLYCKEHDSVAHYSEQARSFAETYNFPVQQVEFTAKQRIALFRVFPNSSHIPYRLFSGALPLAKDLLIQGDSSLWIARLYLEMAAILEYRREFNQAKESIELGLSSLPQSLNQPSVLKGKLYLAKANHFLLEFGTEDSASHYLELAKHEVQDHAKGLLSWYIIAAKLAQRQGNLFLAEEYALKQLSYCELTNNYEYRDLLVYNQLSRICLNMGDYDRALSYLEQARASIRKSNSMGELNNLLGEYQEALKYLNFSESRILRDGGYVKNYLPNTYRNLGNTYLGMEEYNLAEEFYYKAFHCQDQRDYFDSLELHVDLTNLYLAQDRFEEALTELEAGMIYLDRVADVPQIMIYLHHRFYATYIGLDQPSKAMASVQQAMHLLFPEQELEGPGSFPPLNNQDHPHTFYSLLYAMANTYAHFYPHSKNRSDLDSAFLYFCMADEIIDSLRIQFQGDAVKRILSQTGFSAYFQAIRICQQLFDISGEKKYLDKAFYFAERSKSYRLHQAVRESEARQFLNVPDSLLVKERQLIHQIQHLEQTVQRKLELGREMLAHGQRDTMVGPREQIHRRIFATRQAYQHLIQRFERDFPTYYEQKYNSEVLSLSALQSLCQQSNSGLIEYLYEDSTLIAFVISPDTSYFRSIPLSFDLDSAIQSLRNHLINYWLTLNPSEAEFETHNQAYIALAYQLYQEIMEPFIASMEGVDQLTIVPDGSLGYLPFEILLTELPESASQFRSHPYLLRKFALTYSFSAKLQYRRQNHTFSIHSPRILAIRPDFPDTEQTFASIESRRRDGFSPLKYSKEEVHFISEQFNTTLLEAGHAVKGRILQELSGGEYSIIHLATHAKSHDDFPRKAKIAFTPIPDSTEDNDFLTYHEIFNLRLNTDMIVLSACETGLGEFQKGEGIMSLSRAFAFAGAKSIITTLWSVDDKSTSTLMRSFYEGLGSGFKKSKAMQEAKLSYLKAHDDRFSHPFFWAGPVVIGNEAAIWKPVSHVLFSWGLIGLVLLGIIFIFVKSVRPFQ